MRALAAITLAGMLVIMLFATGVAHASGSLSASSSSGSCMTQREFAKVRKGQTVAQVARIVGSRGHVDASSRAGTITAQVRSWQTCTPYGAASASFLNGHLTAKSAVFA